VRACPVEAAAGALIGSGTDAEVVLVDEAIASVVTIHCIPRNS